MKTEIVFIKPLNRDITFYIGQNKNENFDVIDKGCSTDLWFHLMETSSCHVVAIIPDDLSNKEKQYIIKAGAILCKTHTNKFKRAKDVEIIYTQIKNIEKTKYAGCVKIINEKSITV